MKKLFRTCQPVVGDVALKIMKMKGGREKLLTAAKLAGRTGKKQSFVLQGKKYTVSRATFFCEPEENLDYIKIIMPA